MSRLRLTPLAPLLLCLAWQPSTSDASPRRQVQQRTRPVKHLPTGGLDGRFNLTRNGRLVQATTAEEGVLASARYYEGGTATATTAPTAEGGSRTDFTGPLLGGGAVSGVVNVHAPAGKKARPLEPLRPGGKVVALAGGRLYRDRKRGGHVISRFGEDGDGNPTVTTEKKTVKGRVTARSTEVTAESGTRTLTWAAFGRNGATIASGERVLQPPP